MAIAVSGEALDWMGNIEITCVGGTSLIEVNQDATGWVKASGGPVGLDGVIPTDVSFRGYWGNKVQLRFTGGGTVSYKS